MRKKLCRAVVQNPNHKSKFDSFEIMTMREYFDPVTGGTYFDEVRTTAQYLDKSDSYGDIFYRVFAMYRNNSPKIARAIGDFNDIEDAVTFLFELTGEKVKVESY